MSKTVLIIYCTLASFGTFAQDEWMIPDEEKTKHPSIYFDETSVRSGLVIYQKNCASCHGTLGKANFKPLFPSPGDLSAEKTAKNTDGELFFKINEGKGLMPSFKNVISDIEKWQVISYIRNSQPGFEQIVDFNAEIEKYEGKVNIDVQTLEYSKRLKIYVTGEKDGKVSPLRVSLSASTKCTFGDLQIGDIVKTDKYGYAFIDFPEGMPGDKNGNLVLTIKLTEEEVYGNVFVKDTFKIAEPFKPVNITEQRAMWATAGKAPLWLVFTYFGIVAIVWGFILYILLLLRKIKKLKTK